jgi:hypothetical protein
MRRPERAARVRARQARRLITLERVLGDRQRWRGIFTTGPIPGDDRVRRLFALDRRDPARVSGPPADGRLVTTSRFWQVVENC